MNLGYISKAVGAALGAIFAILAVFGLGDGTVVFGISQDAALAVLTPLIAFLTTFLAPKNSNT